MVSRVFPTECLWETSSTHVNFFCTNYNNLYTENRVYNVTFFSTLVQRIISEQVNVSGERERPARGGADDKVSKERKIFPANESSQYLKREKEK